MERYEVSEGARLAEMIEAAEHGEEVVITRNGEQVAHVTATSPERTPKGKALSGADLVRELEELRKEFPPAVFTIDWSNAVRDMRDEERF